MPAAFPERDFRAFGIAAAAFFPSADSYEAEIDPQQKRVHFTWSWQAVRYRYRGCFECNEQFKALLDDEASDWWKGGGSDEELTYKLERCIYQFFTSGLSVFDSFAFCLYFYGNASKAGRLSRCCQSTQHHTEYDCQSIQRRVPRSGDNGASGGPV